MIDTKGRFFGVPESTDLLRSSLLASNLALSNMSCRTQNRLVRVRHLAGHRWSVRSKKEL